MKGPEYFNYSQLYGGFSISFPTDSLTWAYNKLKSFVAGLNLFLKESNTMPRALIISKELILLLCI